MTPSKAPTRRRHAVRGLRMAQNPHRSQPEVRRIAYKTWHSTGWREKLAQRRPSTGISAKTLAQHTIKRQFRANLSALGELFRTFAMTQSRRANFFAHQAQHHGDIETNNTTARPQQRTAETGITSAPEKRAKKARFSPAKAMSVSIAAQPAPAKAMAVSDSQAAWSAGPGCGARGQWCGPAGRPVGGQRYKRRQTGAI